MKYAAAFLCLIAIASAASAKPRPARCVIESAGEPSWRGPCRFEAERGGSFSISPMRGHFGGGIGVISLAVVRPGLGEVRGLTRDGINSRWGEARRSNRDRACWVGDDFTICVY